MSNKFIIGYDQTKKMLNTLRKLNESHNSKTKVLREQQEPYPSAQSDQNIKNDIAVVNDVDIKLLSNDQADMQLTDEQKTIISGVIESFKQQVSALVEFRPGFTVSKEQIRLDGGISNMDMKFTIAAGEDTGLYLVSNMVKVTPEIVDFVTKLSAFYQVFVDGMNQIITQRKTN